MLPSGKINRQALSPGLGVPLTDREGLVLPRSDVEQKLAEIWRQLLVVEQVGIDQNFFELGGHSLLVLQMIDRIRRIFELELPVRSVFDDPTIEGSAAEPQKAQVFRTEGSGSDCATAPHFCGPRCQPSGSFV